MSHDSEVQVLLKMGVLEKIWLWEMDFKVAIVIWGQKGNFGAKVGL